MMFDVRLRSLIRVEWLYAFRAVIQTGSVTGAASVILRTQPQVSRMISSLENELGVALFRRQGRRLIPTPHAREFLQAIAPILRGLDSIDDTAQSIWSRRGRKIAVSAEPFLLHSLVPNAITECAKATALSFSIDICMRSAGLWKEQANADCAVVALPFSQTDFQPTIFAEVDMVAALPAGHPLLNEVSLDLKDLAAFPFISLGADTLMRSQIDFAAVKAGVSLNNIAETTSGVTACALVAKGLGVSIVDPIVAASFESQGVLVRPTTAGLRLTYGFLVPREYKAVDPVTLFMRHCAQAAARVGGSFVRLAKEFQNSL
jgi:DNA-binding transcriptional LysR family regulator